jgi:hypothetical protein
VVVCWRMVTVVAMNTLTNLVTCIAGKRIGNATVIGVRLAKATIVLYTGRKRDHYED